MTKSFRFLSDISSLDKKCPFRCLSDNPLFPEMRKDPTYHARLCTVKSKVIHNLVGERSGWGDCACDYQGKVICGKSPIKTF